MSRADDLKERRARVAALKDKGSTYKEIAKELGITVGIVASDLRAVKRDGAGAKSAGASKTHARAKTAGTAAGPAEAKAAHESKSTRTNAAKTEVKSTEAADLLKHVDKTIRSLAPAAGDADRGEGKPIVNPSLAKLAAPANETPAPPANGNKRAARVVSSADDPRFRERQYFESLNDNEKYDYLVNRRNEDRFLLVSVVIVAVAALILICL
jgi:transposase-like protein